jgi:Fic family protein
VGTDYKPKDNIYQIGDQVEEYLAVLGNAHHSLNKAFTTLVLIAYIQPFADGNKRTSRMLTNAALLSHGYPPLSFRSIDEVEYKKAIILCYENNNVYLMKKLFWEQYQDACTNYFA